MTFNKYVHTILKESAPQKYKIIFLYNYVMRSENKDKILVTPKTIVAGDMYNAVRSYQNKNYGINSASAVKAATRDADAMQLNETGDIGAFCTSAGSREMYVIIAPSSEYYNDIETLITSIDGNTVREIILKGNLQLFIDTIRTCKFNKDLSSREDAIFDRDFLDGL